MRIKKISTGIIISILMVLLVCNVVLAQGVLNLWCQDRNLDRSQHRGFNWVYREFEKATGIKIKVAHAPIEDLLKKTLAAFAAGTGPDIMDIDRAWLGAYLKNDLLAPFPPDLQEKWESMAVPAFKKFEVKGKVYELPIWVDVYALNWNKDMFKEAGLDPNSPPQTWEEFRAYAKKLTKYDENGKIVRVGYAIRYMGNPTGVVQKHLWALWSAKASIITPYDTLTGGRTNFNNKGGYAAIDLIKKMLYEDKSTAFGFGDPRDAFVEKKAAMQISECAAIPSRAFKEAPDLNYGMALPPHPKWGIRVTNINGCPSIVVVDGPKKDIAFKFIRYLMRPEIQMFIPLTWDVDQLGFGIVPFARFLYKHPWFQNMYYDAVLKMAEYGRPQPVEINYTEASDIFGKYMVQAWFNKISVKEALAKAEKEINALLAEE